MSSLKALLVEDEELIRTMIELNLRKQGLTVVSVRDAELLFAILQHQHFDIILLDIMLPGMSGKEALRRLRASGNNTPVIMLTALRDLHSKVDTLNDGADDYLPKPFEMQELVARVNALIRRSQGKRSIPTDRVLRIGRYDVSCETRVAECTRGRVVLTQKEIELLMLFAQKPDMALTRTEILEEVWGMDVYPTTRTVDNFILKFRKLFEGDPENPRHFVTVRNKGYKFVP